LVFEKTIYTRKPNETIEAQGLDIKLLRKKSNALTPSGLILSYSQEANKKEDKTTALFLQELYKKVYDLETSEKIRIKSWRGKGGIRVWSSPDKIFVEFAGKRDKEDKPNVQVKEYLKEDINKMILCINSLKEEYNNKIPSRYLGEKFYGGNWDSNVFSKRTKHQVFTHLLNILDFYNIIRYNRAGFTSVIKPVREIQEVLK